MQHPFPDFLGAALVEEVGAEVTAGTPADIHAPLISVAGATLGFWEVSECLSRD